MASQSEKEQFGELVLELRSAAGLSQDRVARMVEERAGGHYTGAAVGNWERAKNAPTERRVVEALDQILDAEGRLLGALGFGATAPRAPDMTEERLSALERRVEALEAIGQGVRRIAADPPPIPADLGDGLRLAASEPDATPTVVDDDEGDSPRPRPPG